MDTDFIPFTKIGFIGLGLIGGSIAKNIRKIYPDTTLIGFDVDAGALSDALKDKTLSQTADSVDIRFADCDVIFLCAPTHFNIAYLKQLRSLIKDDCILTDVGSVKADICEAVTALDMNHYFIGGHPMVGSEQSGYHASTDRLLENAYYFVCPSPSVSPEKVNRFSAYIEQLGALPIVYAPEEHDHVTSYISHIPHIIAASLVNLVKDADTDGMYKKLAAGGFKDITRIASSSPMVWEHILTSNATQVTQGLREYIALLQNILGSVEQMDNQAIYDFFEDAMHYRNSVPNKANGVIETHHECFIDIPDEPGTLYQVAKILADNQINIKNAGIANNREEGEGALCLELYHEKDLWSSISVLRKAGYGVTCRSGEKAVNSKSEK